MIIKRLIRSIKDDGLIVTIGLIFSLLYRKVYNYFIFYKFEKSDIHPSAHIKGMKYIHIGKNFNSGIHLRLEAISEHNGKKYTPSIIIKDNVSINDFVHIGATNYIEIGNNVLMASRIYISDHNHGTYHGNQQSNPLIPPNNRLVSNDSHVIIGDNVWIGESVSILPGVTIGKGSIIGANSVVTKDIPDFSIAVGNPAKVIKIFDFATEQWISVKKGND